MAIRPDTQRLVLKADSDASYVGVGDSRLTDARTPLAHNQTSSTITDFNTASDARVALLVEFPQTFSNYTTPLVVTTDAVSARWYNPTGRTITIGLVYASVVTAPTGSSLIVDVIKNGGTTIFTTTGNRATIVAGAKAAVSATPNVTTLAAGEYITVIVAQVGSTLPGDKLTVTVGLS